ncbi:hypothetical protein KSD_70960 [Ktedonobacter sp. SOSP1-85]|uniref:family 16 glycoside hydrolase n=1 Tax=Ktedonobacter sp. SOSP1-85 TaxID=2778367 RepID=UPI0019158CBE|nr:family 16 glycoside hydrolase [Ktedonobacter sp. SOSP1-85]GHO79325.1 hypothetical protein KSD_70960 [Ktedonobacter sp. SOSP1-85]
MKCHQCQTEFAAGAAFCFNCGAPVVEEAPAPSERIIYDELPEKSIYQEYSAPTQAPSHSAALPLTGTGDGAAVMPTLPPVMPVPPVPVAPPMPALIAPPPYPPYRVSGEQTSPPSTAQGRAHGKKWMIIGGAIALVCLVICGGSGLLVFSLLQQGNMPGTSAQTSQNDPRALYTQIMSKKPTYTDDFDGTGVGHWNAYERTMESCRFQDGSYHVSENQSDHWYYCGTAQFYYDFALQVDATILQGDRAGIVFRTSHGSNDQSKYIFVFDGQGNSELQGYDASGTQKILQSNLANRAFKAGLGQKNIITLIVQGSTVHFYVNGTFLYTCTNLTIDGGDIGLYAHSQAQPTEVSYAHARIWIL